MINKKIHLIGSTGSGKSYTGNILSQKYDIPHFDLDDIFWQNDATHFGIKENPKERDRKLKDILMNDAWIIEGVYYRWLEDSFKNADHILILTVSVWIRDIRVIKRFLKRKFGFEVSKKKETWKGLFDLLVWNHKFDNDNLKRIKEFLEKLNLKPKYCKTELDVIKIIKSY